MSECVHNSVQRQATALSIRPPSVGLANSAADVKLRTVKSQKVFSLLHLYLRLTNLFLALSLYVSLSLYLYLSCSLFHLSCHTQNRSQGSSRKTQQQKTSCNVCDSGSTFGRCISSRVGVKCVCVCVATKLSKYCNAIKVNTFNYVCPNVALMMLALLWRTI